MANRILTPGLISTRKTDLSKEHNTISISFGFIGCGQIADSHAEVIKSEGHTISAVAAKPGSKNIIPFSARHGVQRQFDSWQKMVNEIKTDALVVALPWDQTENVIEEIIKNGIPCLVEKPIALSSIKLSKIINNTKSFHDQIMIGYNRRFYNFIPLIQKAISEKELVSIELNFPEATEKIIRTKTDKIINHILVYMSSHWLDLTSFLAGQMEVLWIHRKKETKTVSAYNGILKLTGKDTPVHLQANFNAPSNTSISFNFKDSIYRLCPIECLTIYQGMNLIEATPELPLRQYQPKIIETIRTDSRFKPGFLNQARHFINACVKKEIPLQGCTLNQALYVTELCEAIQKY